MSDNFIIHDLPTYATFLDYQKKNPDKQITLKEVHLKNTDITIIRLPNVVKIKGNFIIENNYELKIIIDTDQLIEIGGHFRIVDNWYLRSINGFSELTRILTHNDMIILGCEGDDFLTSCKRGFVIKNNWNLQNICHFKQLEIPDDKKGDQEFFLIMNNPFYDIKEITDQRALRLLFNTLRFKADSLLQTEETLTESDQLSNLDNLITIDNTRWNIPDSESVVNLPISNIGNDTYKKEYQVDDLIYMYIIYTDSNSVDQKKPIFVNIITEVGTEANNQIPITFEYDFKEFINDYIANNASISNSESVEVKLLRQNHLKFSPDFFTFEPLEQCQMPTNPTTTLSKLSNCPTTTYTTYNEYKIFIDSLDDNDTSEIIPQNRDVYFNFGHVHLLEHYFKFQQFCLAESYFNNYVILDGSLSFSFVKEIEGISNLKKITGNFNVFNNNLVTRLEHFDNLEQVNGDFILYNNPKLKFIGNFSKLAQNNNVDNLSGKILIKSNGIRTVSGKNNVKSFLLEHTNKEINGTINIHMIASIIFFLLSVSFIIYFINYKSNNK